MQNYIINIKNINEAVTHSILVLFYWIFIS